jgi:type I restriction-modification system DNA methylase subunit
MTTSAVTVNQLEAHLWEAANILRGPVDAADFKTYIFPLLFFKRLSDVHDEEYQTALEESGGDEEYAHFPQNYRFQVPEGCHWRDVRTVTTAPRTGRMAVVLPHGALCRMGAEGKIRQKILGMDLLEAVIGLGPNLFYGTGLAACILVFRQRKAPDRKNTMLILDASKEFKTGRAQNELLPEHVERIHGWYHAYQDVEGVARVVTLEEVAANDYNLNIPRYVEPKVDQEVLTVEEAMQRLQASAAAAFAAEDKLIAMLKREGLLQ